MVLVEVIGLLPLIIRELVMLRLVVVAPTKSAFWKWEVVDAKTPLGAKSGDVVAEVEVPNHVKGKNGYTLPPPDPQALPVELTRPSRPACRQVVPVPPKPETINCVLDALPLTTKLPKSVEVDMLLMVLLPICIWSKWEVDDAFNPLLAHTMEEVAAFVTP